MDATVHIALGIVLAVLILAFIVAVLAWSGAGFRRMQEEFRNAPAWQRIVFVGLLAVLVIGLIFWFPAH
jgi:succinate dehydrogenase hydrophobic anchor subunit